MREKAKERGLPSATEADLVNALFSDGLSTAEAVSDISGRGVGMSAVRDAAHKLGGTISVVSKRGIGTILRFRFPLAELTRPISGSRPTQSVGLPSRRRVVSSRSRSPRR